MQKHYVKPFHCDPLQPCYCGSSQPFGECCASTATNRQPPRGVEIVPGFLSSVDCRKLIRFADKQEARWLKVRDVEKSTPQKNVEKRDPGRVTQVVDMARRQDFLDATVRRALVEVSASKFGAPDFFEPPYMLRYKVGGKYHEHADSESFDPQRGLFYRVADRDVSLLIYLNDNFEGGQLHFKRLNYTYQPQAGDLVMFPSNNLYMHQAKVVTRGSKYALVSWSCLKATRKLFQGATRWPPVKI